jgi:poly(3-hydroxyalkanoate) depolymerase
LTTDHTALEDAEVRMETVGRRILRVARWTAPKRRGATAHPPLLFFNGIGANIELVAPFARRLGNRDFIIFDMPGVGGSPDPLVPYNPFTMSATAAKLMDQLGYEGQTIDVMGVSWGGAMAQHFAMQYAGRVGRVILAATSAGWLMMPGKISALSKMANPRRYVDPSFMADNFKTLYGGDLSGSGDHVRRLRPPSGLGYMYQLIAMLGWTSAPALPFFMKAETLIMMGDDDRIVPLANGKFLASLIPNSELHVVEGGGHLFLVSQAESCIGKITAFLDAPREEAKAAA